MTHAKGTHLGGVRDLDTLRARCNVCEDSGCWRWKLSMDDGGAKVWMRFDDGVFRVIRGRRAALILSGVSIPAGKFVYAKPDCTWAECVNPEHCAIGTRKQSIQSAVKRGAFDTPARMRAMESFRKLQQRLTEDQLTEIAASDVPAKDLAPRYGVTPNRINEIRRLGAGRRRRPTSVFEWRGAA